MSEKIRFDKKDIGAELLSILTTGLYRDTLDTLREYIQNGIDANADKMTIKITPDTITIEDNGHGMDETTARHAIRLGISEKNPLVNVGFRGIGIYSAFNLCNLAEIYTRADGQDERKITFNFKNMRDELKKEQERRKEGHPSELYLEKILRDSVYIEISSEHVIVKPKGTKIIFSNLLDEVYQRLNNWGEVSGYLHDVVPLPFRPDFKYKSIIEKKLVEAKDKIVAITLIIGNKEDQLFRPYHDGIFTYKGQYEPKFFEMDRFGFAWVCINDSRTVLGDSKLRGLLIKKFGFSISNRSFLEPFFSRVVFNRRITGELIIQHDNLIPNAARSDFEHNSTRETFIKSLPRFIKSISKWANDIQEEEKAKEVLADVKRQLLEINQSLPENRRNPEEMLKLNVRLSNLKDELKLHEKKLAKKDSDKLKETQSLLHDCITFISTELASSRSRKVSMENQVKKAIVTAAKKKPEYDNLTSTEKKFESLWELLNAFGGPINTDIKGIIDFIDNNILKEYLEKNQYQEALRQLKDYLGESF